MNVTSLGKRYFAGKTEYLEMGNYYGFSRWAQCNHKYAYKREARESVREREGDMTTGGCVRMPLVEGAHPPRNVGGLWKLEKQGTNFSARTSRRDQLCGHLDFSPVD